MTKEAEAHRLLHEWSLQIYHRLKSIAADAAFVEEVAAQLRIPAVANLRCGVWYVPPKLRAGLAHFKSGDGHYGEWSFSVRRPNLHLLSFLDEHGAMVLVDATRMGKKFPDSLSKTVPIWVCVINRALLGFPDAPLMLPPWVSPNERNSIEALLPEWVDRLRHLVDATDSKFEWRRGKPLGVLWIHRDSTLLDSYEQLGFVPIFALTASRVVADDERADIDGYYYVPGAGDDEETWATGLSADLFFENQDFLLKGGSEGCEQRVQAVVDARPSCSTLLSSKVYTLWDTGLSIGLANVFVGGDVWKDFDTIIELGAPPRDVPQEYKGKFIGLDMLNRKGKPDRRYGLQRALKTVLETTKTSGANVLIVAPAGCDYAISAAVAFLSSKCTFTLDGVYARSEREIVPNKEDVNKALLNLSWIMPLPVSPARATLKQIHRYFMSSGYDLTNAHDKAQHCSDAAEVLSTS
mmetsp:Transcript_4817/g.14519  ORF Transcript_4817/g.14519 Transcript_4817/m.14519 type:complete len:465 (+) Transcript_4817:75-1469(+)